MAEKAKGFSSLWAGCLSDAAWGTGGDILLLGRSAATDETAWHPISDSIAPEITEEEDESLTGELQAGEGSHAETMASGTIVAYLDLDYWVQLQWIASLLGATSASPTVVEAATSWKHTWSLHQSYDTRWFTWCRELDIATDVLLEFPSLAPTGFRLTGEKGRYLRAEFDVSGYMPITDGSGTNQVADMASVTVPTWQRVKMAGASFELRVNDQSGGALSGTDEIAIENFSLDIDLGIETLVTSKTAPNPDEPSVNARPTYMLTFSNPYLEDLTLYNNFVSRTLKKGALWIQGAALGANNYLQEWLFPQLVLTGNPIPVDSPARIPQNITCKLEKAASNPTGMTDTTLYVESTNSHSAALFT